MRSSSKGPWGNGGHRECGEGPAGIPGPYPGPLGVHVRAGVAAVPFPSAQRHRSSRWKAGWRAWRLYAHRHPELIRVACSMACSAGD